MKNIDFLPKAYHEKDVTRRARWWQLGVVMLFGAVICVTVLFQWQSRRQAADRLAQVEPLVSAARAKETRLAQLQARLTDQRRYAELFAYVQLRWPRTQIINSALRDVPEELTIEELNIGHQQKPQTDRPASNSQFAGQAESDDSTEIALLPPSQDLQELQAHYDTLETVVDLRGNCQQATTLHTWLAKLESQRLFRKVELLSMETHELDETHTRLQFSARVTVALPTEFTTEVALSGKSEDQHAAQGEEVLQ